MTKRVLDVLVAGAALLVLAPVLAVIALLVRVKLGPPVLFRQERAGLGGQPFVLYKFRTMADVQDASGVTLPDAERLPPFGAALRALSLDELPELWNVLRGEMSMVGPRPLPTAYLPRYTRDESRRHDVRPGLTGWAQINGRNAIGWDDRLAMDVWYVDHRSLRLDVRILVRTVGRVLSRSGITAEGQATMSELRPDPPVAPTGPIRPPVRARRPPYNRRPSSG